MKSALQKESNHFFAWVCLILINRKISPFDQKVSSGTKAFG